jgi:hypothetical protein
MSFDPQFDIERLPIKERSEGWPWDLGLEMDFTLSAEQELSRWRTTNGSASRWVRTKSRRELTLLLHFTPVDAVQRRSRPAT